MNLLKTSLIAASLALALSVNLFAQETYTVQSKTLKEALEIISKKAKLPFIVDESLIENKKAANIKDVKTIEKALKQVLKDTKLEAVIKNDTIIIRKKRIKKSGFSSSNLGEVEVLGNKESAYGKTTGYVATKSSTGSKMDIDITEIPQSISVITRDFMDVTDAQTIQNTLSYSSSVAQPYGENGDTRYNWSGIRGGSNLYDSTFLDGLRLYYYMYGVPKPDMYGLERVEVLKGPSSSLYGASSPGGLLSLQSKRANNTKDKEIELTIGSKKTKSFAFDVNNSISNDIYLRLTAKYKQKDEKPSVFSSERNYFFNPALRYKVNDSTTLDFIASYSKDEMPAPTIKGGSLIKYIYADELIKHKDGLSALLGSFGYPLSALEIENAAKKVKKVNYPENLYAGHKSDTLERKTISFSTFLNHKINEKTQINSAFRYLKLDNDYLPSTLEDSKLAEFLLSQDYTKVSMEQKKFLSNLEAFVMDNNIEHKWNIKNIKNTSMLGLDFQIQKGKEKRTAGRQYWFDMINPNYDQDIQTPEVFTSDEEDTLKQLGIYAQNQAKINDKIILSTALRYDKVKEDFSDKISNTSSTQKDDNISGRIGLSYLFDSGFTPYVSYATSFRTNLGSDKNGKKFIPSIGKQIELGAKYNLKKVNGFLSTAIYKIEESNILTSDLQNQGYLLQEASSEVKGFEFDLAFEPIEHMNLILSYTKLKTKQINKEDPDLDGLKLDLVPNSSFALWSDYTIPDTKIGDFKFGAGIKYIGENQVLFQDSLDVVNGQPEKMVDINSYVLVDTMIGTSYENMNFSFNISNVFDKKEEIYPEALSTYLTQGRTFNFKFKYKF